MNDLTDAALRKMATEMCPFAIPLDDCPTCQRIYQRYIALRDAARAEQREADAKIVCRRCRAGEPVIHTEEYQYAGAAPGIFHVIKGGAMNGEDLVDRCDAAAIRAQGGER